MAKTTSSQTKKNLMIVGVVVALLVIGVIIWQVAGKKAESPTTEVIEAPKKKRISVPSNIIPISQRPYTELIPFDQTGRNLRVQVNSLPLAADSAEYLIEYSVGKTTAKNAAGKDIKVPEAEVVTGIQGSMGELVLASFPSKSELLLGTCSAGGACTHHSGLSTGTLTITYQSADSYATSQKFNYFEKYDKQAPTEDGYFILASDALKKEENFVIINSAGLPAGLMGEVVTVTDPFSDTNASASIPLAYQVAFSGTTPLGKADIVFNYDVAQGTDPVLPQIFAYDSATQTWLPLATTHLDGQFSATDEKIHSLYVLVNSLATGQPIVMAE